LENQSSTWKSTHGITKQDFKNYRQRHSNRQVNTRTRVRRTRSSCDFTYINPQNDLQIYCLFYFHRLIFYIVARFTIMYTIFLFHTHVILIIDMFHFMFKYLPLVIVCHPIILI
jgi:hypothetical protein